MKLPEATARSPLEPVPEERAFFFQHGARAQSLAEFADALEAAVPEVVWFHRDHFAPWLREVVQDVPLARRFETYAAAGGDPGVYRETVARLVRRRVEELGTRPSQGRA